MPEDWKIKQKLISGKVGQNALFLFQEKEFTACRFPKAGFSLFELVRQSFSQLQYFPIYLSQRNAASNNCVTKHDGSGSKKCCSCFWQLSTSNNEFSYESGNSYCPAGQSWHKGWHQVAAKFEEVFSKPLRNKMLWKNVLKKTIGRINIYFNMNTWYKAYLSSHHRLISCRTHSKRIRRSVWHIVFYQKSLTTRDCCFHRTASAAKPSIILRKE